MKIIKGILEEELQNSLRMKVRYGEALQKLPSGCLSKKIIKGRPYYYLVKRSGRRVCYQYLGKISAEQLQRYDEAKKLRKKYRHNLSMVKKQISYLRGALRGKKAV